MASNQPHRLYDPRDLTTPQSIPLQDLPRPPDSRDITGRNPSRIVTGSGDGGASGRLARGRSTSIRGMGSAGRSYERVAEDSPSSATRDTNQSGPYSRNRASVHPLPVMEDDELSLEDPSMLQEAIGFAGLSFNPEQQLQQPPYQPATNQYSSNSFSGGNSMYSYQHNDTYGGGYNFPAVEDDTAPLTDPAYLQPVGQARVGREQGPSGFQAGSSNDLGRGGSSTAMLGDDLPRMEAGLRASGSGQSLGGSYSRSRSRSLSPSAAGLGPLSRAGSMVRQMSQRIINLSNEPEILEQSIRRKTSLKHARLTAPPLFPAMTEYAHDEPRSSQAPPVEKGRPLSTGGYLRRAPRQPPLNPLKGKTLGVFSPESKLRLWLCDILVHPVTEPVILVLIVFQTILLSIESSHDVFHQERSKRWGTTWIDYMLLILFVVYTYVSKPALSTSPPENVVIVMLTFARRLEIMAKIIVSGFLVNAYEYTTIDRQKGFTAAFVQKGRDLFSPQRQQTTRLAPSALNPPQPSFFRSLTTLQGAEGQPGHSRRQQRYQLARRAFLRHSFNRLDFVAVVSFWISFVLGITGIEAREHVYVFRMMSCLRIIRLLLLTSGTSVILRSLKKAAPLLVNVAFLIGFFWLIFAIIGIQSFKSSFRRTCVWSDPAGLEPDYPVPFTFCGGQLNKVTSEAEAWVNQDGSPGARKHKGYLCPKQSVCMLQDNPWNNTIGFDNIFQSLELVFVIMSSNTFSDLLYFTTNSDYLVSAMFFAAGIVIMSLWLINLLVAVITSSFQVIREESKTSAFTAKEEMSELEEDEESPKRVNALKRIYDKTKIFWIVVIIYGLLCQSLRSASMKDWRQGFIDRSETLVTFLLVIEIFIRIVADWRNFHRSKQNWVDLMLAIVTAIMQIPPIHNSGAPYEWLTFFQILRIYRVVLAVSLTRELIVVVLGNVSGLLNLIVFVFLLTFLGAIFAVQLFRGELPQRDAYGKDIEVPFFTIYNAFLGMYQILSSENWTQIVYYVTSYGHNFHSSWIGAIFFVIWFTLANFIVLNMFIAVIQENFDITEDEKRLQQVKAFLQRRELGGSSNGTLSLSTIFKLGRESRHKKDPLDYGPATMEMLLKDAVVKDFLDEMEPENPTTSNNQTVDEDRPREVIFPATPPSFWGKLLGRFRDKEPNPFYSRLQFSRAYGDLDPRAMAKEVVSAQERRKKAQREYLTKHPRYNTALYIFKPSNPIRRLCQRIVGPGRGSQRIEGVEPVKVIWYSFSGFIYVAIVAMVLLACITTPLYQKEYLSKNPNGFHRNWFTYTDLGFSILFTIEAVIKVVADGVFWTPNAYFRSSWGFIDGLVLITLWINVVTSFYGQGAVSRAVGAFKALRALRLLNVSDSARDTFHSVIILGGWKVVSAAFVSLSLLIPFALYGLNLFNGQMKACNDIAPNITNLTNCIGEFASTPFQWEVLAPRVVSNPYYDFDNFGSALSILFQIVSEEGWINVMWSAQSITGKGLQPQPFASQGNALFFVAFNLLGAVFVLTLFVSVFMRNYTEQTGVAFLTAEQRSWLELRKLLRQISPSKRPSNQPHEKWKNWCYRQAVKKHGYWQRFITITLVLHLILLMLEFYPEVEWWERTRIYLFLVFTLFYMANIVVRIVGLTWPRFRRSSWDLYSILSVSGTFITTILVLIKNDEKLDPEYVRPHKLFLVSIALLLIPRNNSLDQLFKTAAASLTAISNLLATWCVLFLVYAIALTQTLGLTKFGSLETGNLNVRTVPKALILLFRASCGEAWNQIMEDFANIREPYCVTGKGFFESDCGSAPWARALFISWNILSMYIFVSLFVSLIYESFSYVYQRSSGLSSVSRDEIRRFKQAWATFDPEGTGFITKEAFPRLLGELSGVFEMRIYDGEFTVGRILEDCRVDQSTVTRRNTDPMPGVVDGVSLTALRRRLSQIPVHEIRRRRKKFNIFFEEVLVSADPDRGISFTSVLMILAHYNVISDSKSLRLEEYLRRRARLQRVEEQVRRNIVIGFFDTLYWFRKFRKFVEARESSRMTGVPQLGVPEIFIDDEDEGPAHGQTAANDGGWSPLAGDLRGELSATPSASPSGSPQRSSPNDRQNQHRTGLSVSDPYDNSSEWHNFARPLSTAGARGADHSRQNSAVSAQDVLEVLDQSAWGESIRRSFTARRPSRSGGSSGPS
ncbi:MAG: calcium channel protein [Geoglossum umbratile]|nr:MAG: calcium channel protein [Geoglossum umbratile]